MPGPMPRNSGNWPKGPEKTVDRGARLKDAQASYNKLAGMETPPAETLQAVKDLGGVVPEKAPARAADGKFAAAQTEQPAATPEDAESKHTEGDRQKAVAALKRAKVPQAAMDAISEDDRVQWGLDLAKSESEAARKVTAAAQATKSTETVHADSATKPAEQPATNGSLRGLADALGLDEAGERLLAGEFEKRDKASAAESDKLHSMMASTLTRLARTELTKEFPDLADDEAFKALDDEIEFEQVKPKYAHITDPYELVKACISNLAKGAFSESMAAKAKESARKESARRDAGQPAVGVKDGKGGKLGKREYAVASMNMLGQGIPPDQVRARLGG